MPTEKEPALIYLFNQFNAGNIPNGIITNDHIVNAINNTPPDLNTKNPANFIKDIVRSNNANLNWPQQIAAARFTARQRYGNSQVFEFIPYTPNQNVPFPDRFFPAPGMPITPVQSVAIPYAARQLGRKEESWLMQAITQLKIIETHLSLYSPDRQQIRDVTHLQMSMKTQPEIDSVFLASHTGGGAAPQHIYSMVICEAKQINERILEDQIKEQTRKAFTVTAPLHDPIISNVRPFVIQIVSHNNEKLVFVVEFDPVSRANYNNLYSDLPGNNTRIYDLNLNAASSALYRLVPVVRGINM